MKFNKEFEGMSQEEKFQILQVTPEMAEKAKEVLEILKKGVHLEGLMQAEVTALTWFGRDAEFPPLNYTDKVKSTFIREKDGTMTINVSVSDVQRKAVKYILGELAKKILAADLTGLTLPIFMFHSDTYLQK